MTFSTLTVAASLFEATLGGLVGAGGVYVMLRAAKAFYWK